MKRPLLVTVLAVIYAITGIVFIVASAAATSFLTSLFGAVGTIIGAGAVVVGFLLLGMAYGLYTLKFWVWWLVEVFNGISLISNLATGSWLSFLFSLFWLWYFYHVRRSFDVKISL